ncbi:MAG: BON domain-containing protein [Chromatiales bacterium]
MRDEESTTVTPVDQKEDATDLEITAAIRRAVVADESLSTNAHNVKIITQDGSVTLRGPVDSEAEKTRIAILAQEAAGVTNLNNQLEIDRD